ncbi:BnaA06g10450D [Brassica napus]|uniref:(rape) hypothetical protein n=1 Tax=Brassica napus TaxID=3708 RepID=A0A078HFL4_BRANA|nr:unnamed protein product [Brassica napus]CDY36592.1 BnaA06g10450D [Brassica napus]
MLRIKRSVSAGYSQVFSLISYNQVQLTSNCFLVNSELISFCYRTRRKKRRAVLYTLSIIWHFTGITSLILMCNLYFWYLNNRKN